MGRVLERNTYRNRYLDRYPAALVGARLCDMSYSTITQRLGHGGKLPAGHQQHERSSTGSWSANDVWKMVDEVQGGDLDAFSTLYVRHVDRIYDYILLRTRNQAIAEDLTSETFLRALIKIDSITYHGSSFRAWLMTIARNLIIDHVKAVRRKLEVALPANFDVESNIGDPVAYTFDRDSCRELRGHLDQLTSDQRQCIVLRFFEERSVSEVAQTMERSSESVRALQLRALRRLAACIRQGTRWT